MTWGRDTFWHTFRHTFWLSLGLGFVIDFVKFCGTRTAVQSKLLTLVFYLFLVVTWSRDTRIRRRTLQTQWAVADCTEIVSHLYAGLTWVVFTTDTWPDRPLFGNLGT